VCERAFSCDAEMRGKYIYNHHYVTEIYVNLKKKKLWPKQLIIIKHLSKNNSNDELKDEK
jgi:hypothetical protein